MFPSKLANVEGGTMVGLLTAAGVYLIYQNALPSTADIREAAPHDESVERERKKAAWESLALIGGVFLISRDLNSYIVSGIALVGIDYMHKHANAIHPATQQVDVNGGADSVAPDMADAYAMPDYTDEESA